MDNKKKYFIPIITIILIFAIIMMIGIIYFESRRTIKTNVELETDIETELGDYNQYEGPRIPELTPGETLEEIEEDLNIIDSEIEEIEDEMEKLERELEELL